MGLDIRVLGRTRVLVDGVEQDLGGRRPAEVLAVLVAADGETVDVDRLADRVWRGRPPGGARATLQAYVAGLRRVIEPGVAARDATALVTQGSGYALRVPQDQVDVRRFEALLREAEALRRAGATAAAIDVLQRARETWEPGPFEGVADVVDVQPLVARLEEQALTAVETLAELQLELGRAASAAGELVEAAQRHPLRERTQSLLARAMYAAGRQTDALDVLRRTRERLADELGLDPSAGLRELEAAILRQDPGLGAGAPAEPPRPPRGGGRLVGRAEELRLMEHTVARVASGRATAVVVSGEPGIGKTALVEELVGRTGLTARWGRCPDTAGVPPYWLWQQVLGGLPEVSGDAGARFALGTDIARRLREAAGPDPLLVVVDDLQWADDDSLHVLEVVLGQLTDSPVALVATVREEHTSAPRVAAVLSLMARMPGAVRIALHGLDAGDVGDLVSRATGTTLSPVAARRLAERSGGNPLFVSQLALAGDQEGSLPAGVRDLLRLRVDRLGTLALDLLGVLAVGGRDLPVGLVAELLDRPLPEVGDVLQEARSRGFVAEVGQGRVAVAHDLLREVVLDALGPARRAALHGLIAESLSRGVRAAGSAAAIAVHLSEAAAGSLSVPAAQACLTAAQEALAGAGDAEAAELAARGLDHTPGDATLLAADLHLVVGAAQRRLGLLEQGRQELEAAARLARRAGDDERFARAALAGSAGGAGGYFGSMAAVHGSDTVLLEEAARSGNVRGPVRSAVLSALALQRAAVGLDAAGLVEEALANAGGDPGALARATEADFVVHWTPASAERRLRLARSLLETATSPSHEAGALHLLRCALTENARAEEAAAASRRFSRLVESRGDGDQLLLDLWWQSDLALARGAFDEARALADRAVSASPTASPAAEVHARMSRQTIEGIIAWHERRLVDEVPDVVDLTTVDPDWLIVLAQAYAQSGRRSEAYAAVEQLRLRPASGTRATVHTILLTDVFLELEDAERAAELLPTLRSYGDTMVVLWPGLTMLGPSALYRGGVLALTGDPSAEDELRRAVELSERFGFEPFAARARALLSRLR